MTRIAQDDLKDRIDSLDLSPIKGKLIEEKGWSVGFTDQVESVYKGFLYLNGAFPEQKLVPSLALDEMWHAHILDTKKYAADCDAVFGYFLHHYPYFGLSGEDDQKALKRAYDETIKVFQSVLGLDIVAMSSDGANTCYSNCGNSQPQISEATCYSNCGNSQPPVAEATCYSNCGNS